MATITSAGTGKIETYLGAKAEPLLGFKSPKIAKERLHLPGRVAHLGRGRVHVGARDIHEDDGSRLRHLRLPLARGLRLPVDVALGTAIYVVDALVELLVLAPDVLDAGGRARLDRLVAGLNQRHGERVQALKHGRLLSLRAFDRRACASRIVRGNRQEVAHQLRSGGWCECEGQWSLSGLWIGFCHLLLEEPQDRHELVR